MAALALSLRIRLRKPGVYTLNEPGASPAAADVAEALRRTELTAWLFAVLLAALPAASSIATAHLLAGITHG